MCTEQQLALVMRQVVEAAKAAFGASVRQVILFGSYARGEQSDASDIDLRLVCGASIGYGELYEISLELEAALGCPVEIVTNPLERMRPAFRRRVLADQVMLYEAA